MNKDISFMAVWSPDGSRLVWGSNDCTICIWDPVSERQDGPDLIGHTSAIKSIVWSPDGKQFASCSTSEITIRIWDLATKKQVGQPLTGHTDLIRFINWSPDGTRLVSCSTDKTVRVWDPVSGRQLHFLRKNTKVWSVDWSPDGTRLAYRLDNGKIHVEKDPTYVVRTEMMRHLPEYVRVNDVAKYITKFIM